MNLPEFLGNPGASQIAKAAAEFAQAVGASDVLAEAVGMGTDKFRLQRVVAEAEILASTAREVAESGLPISAIDDRLLRIVLDGGCEAQTKAMRQRWSHLLANAATRRVPVNTALALILAELTPRQAFALYELVDAAEEHDLFKIAKLKKVGGLDWTDFDHLRRLGLIHTAGKGYDGGVISWPIEDPDGEDQQVEDVEAGVFFPAYALASALGIAVVRACRPLNYLTYEQRAERDSDATDEQLRQWYLPTARAFGRSYARRLHLPEDFLVQAGVDGLEDALRTHRERASGIRFGNRLSFYLRQSVVRAAVRIAPEDHDWDAIDWSRADKAVLRAVEERRQTKAV